MDDLILLIKVATWLTVVLYCMCVQCAQCVCSVGSMIGDYDPIRSEYES